MKFYETKVKVRFCEIDSYKVAWHGHYVSWMEIGRTELASRFGLDPFTLSTEGLLGPVISLEIKFLKPARFNDELTIRTTLRKTETATLQFISEITGPTGNRLATGITTHALTDLDGVMFFQLPEKIRERIILMTEWLEAA